MKTKNLRLERRLHRINENRLSILEAAEAVFAQKGYTQASMDEIAGKAQFSKATLYRYFKSKRDILFEIILNSFREVNQRLGKIAVKKESAEQKLREISRFLLRYYHHKKNISRIFLMERSVMRTMLEIVPEKKGSLSQDERKFMAAVQALKKEIRETICGIFAQGIRDGEFRRFNPLDACHTYEALLHGFYFMRFWHERKYSFDKGADVIQDFFIRGIKKDERVRKGE